MGFNSAFKGLMRIVISEEPTSPITSDFSVVNILSFYYFIYGILSSSWGNSIKRM